VGSPSLEIFNKANNPKSIDECEKLKADDPGTSRDFLKEAVYAIVKRHQAVEEEPE